MPRKLRVEYPGAVYHLMSRGDWREDIYLDDVDRQDFVKTLAEACQKTGWQVHAYCLMRNHYHLVLETPNANLVAGMAWLQSTYTIRLNHRHKLYGHVFSGRYKAQLVEGSGNGYLRTACDYVHLNRASPGPAIRPSLGESADRAAARRRPTSGAGSFLHEDHRDGLRLYHEEIRRTGKFRTDRPATDGPGFRPLMGGCQFQRDPTRTHASGPTGHGQSRCLSATRSSRARRKRSKRIGALASAYCRLRTPLETTSRWCNAFR